MNNTERCRAIVIGSNRLRMKAILRVDIKDPDIEVAYSGERIKTENKRDIRLKSQTPHLPKVDLLMIEDIYVKCRAMSIETGVEHCVDHIWPIAKGGAHHWLNMQILTRKENAEKGSSHDGVSGASYEDFVG